MKLITFSKLVLPFKETPLKLGDSRFQAIKRFLRLERRLGENCGLKKQYVECECVWRVLTYDTGSYRISVINSTYLPSQHIIFHIMLFWKLAKLRVVFNALDKTTTGASLSDVLLTGPRLQDNLTSIVIRFRAHPATFCRDIAKMYRQIFRHEKM